MHVSLCDLSQSMKNGKSADFILLQLADLLQTKDDVDSLSVVAILKQLKIHQCHLALKVFASVVSWRLFTVFPLQDTAHIACWMLLNWKFPCVSDYIIPSLVICCSEYSCCPTDEDFQCPMVEVVVNTSSKLVPPISKLLLNIFMKVLADPTNQPNAISTMTSDSFFSNFILSQLFIEPLQPDHHLWLVRMIYQSICTSRIAFTDFNNILSCFLHHLFAKPLQPTHDELQSYLTTRILRHSITPLLLFLKYCLNSAKGCCFLFQKDGQILIDALVSSLTLPENSLSYDLDVLPLKRNAFVCSMFGVLNVLDLCYDLFFLRRPVMKFDAYATVYCSGEFSFSGLSSSERDWFVATPSERLREAVSTLVWSAAFCPKAFMCENGYVVSEVASWLTNTTTVHRTSNCSVLGAMRQLHLSAFVKRGFFARLCRFVALCPPDNLRSKVLFDFYSDLQMYAKVLVASLLHVCADEADSANRSLLSSYFKTLPEEKFENYNHKQQFINDVVKIRSRFVELDLQRRNKFTTIWAELFVLRHVADTDRDKLCTKLAFDISSEIKFDLCYWRLKRCCSTASEQNSVQRSRFSMHQLRKIETNLVIAMKADLSVGQMRKLLDVLVGGWLQLDASQPKTYTALYGDFAKLWPTTAAYDVFITRGKSSPLLDTRSSHYMSAHAINIQHVDIMCRTLNLVGSLARRMQDSKPSSSPSISSYGHHAMTIVSFAKHTYEACMSDCRASAGGSSYVDGLVLVTSLVDAFMRLPASSGLARHYEMLRDSLHSMIDILSSQEAPYSVLKVCICSLDYTDEESRNLLVHLLYSEECSYGMKFYIVELFLIVVRLIPRNAQAAILTTDLLTYAESILNEDVSSSLSLRCCRALSNIAIHRKECFEPKYSSNTVITQRFVELFRNKHTEFTPALRLALYSFLTQVACVYDSYQGVLPMAVTDQLSCQYTKGGLYVSDLGRFCVEAVKNAPVQEVDIALYVNEQRAHFELPQCVWSFPSRPGLFRRFSAIANEAMPSYLQVIKPVSQLAAEDEKHRTVGAMWVVTSWLVTMACQGEKYLHNNDQNRLNLRCMFDKALEEIITMREVNQEVAVFAFVCRRQLAKSESCRSAVTGLVLKRYDDLEWNQIHAPVDSAEKMPNNVSNGIEMQILSPVRVKSKFGAFNRNVSGSPSGVKSPITSISSQLSIRDSTAISREASRSAVSAESTASSGWSMSSCQSGLGDDIDVIKTNLLPDLNESPRAGYAISFANSVFYLPDETLVMTDRCVRPCKPKDSGQSAYHHMLALLTSNLDTDAMREPNGNNDVTFSCVYCACLNISSSLSRHRAPLHRSFLTYFVEKITMLRRSDAKRRVERLAAECHKQRSLFEDPCFYFDVLRHLLLIRPCLHTCQIVAQLFNIHKIISLLSHNQDVLSTKCSCSSQC